MFNYIGRSKGPSRSNDSILLADRTSPCSMREVADFRDRVGSVMGGSGCLVVNTER